MRLNRRFNRSPQPEVAKRPQRGLDEPSGVGETKSMDSEDLENREQAYQARNESLQHTIDVLASYEASRLEDFGAKAEIAREHDIEQHQIHYVLTHWSELVDYRRQANRDPLDPDAVKASYDDPTMRAMAVGGEAAYECPGCGETFPKERSLRGHLTHCDDAPDGVRIADTQLSAAPVADGAGNMTVSIELTLDEVFRAIKLLPGDLGLNVYTQALSTDLPHDQVRRILQKKDD